MLWNMYNISSRVSGRTKNGFMPPVAGSSVLRASDVVSTVSCMAAVGFSELVAAIACLG